MSRRSEGFTLLEVLAVVLLTGLVLGIALDFYVNLSRASQRATEHMRDIRRATAVLDRVARDLEGAMLITKPPEVDPLSHPWVFLAESQYADEGSDFVKFVTRSHRPASNEVHESDLAMVSYTVRRDEEQRLEILRTATPRMPESLDRDFPRHEFDDLTPLLADRVASFGMRFLDEAGEWTDTWDSSLLVESGEMPRAVEIHVAMALDDSDSFDAEPVVYKRRVLLPVRPRTLEELFDPERVGGDGADPDEQLACNELTIGDCTAGTQCIQAHALPANLQSLPMTALRGLSANQVEQYQGETPHAVISSCHEYMSEECARCL
jgi:type II secretory pathway component PulJ